MKYDIMIRFVDGKEMRVEGVEDYGVHTESRVYYYLKDGMRSFFGVEHVMAFVGVQVTKN